MEKTCKHIGNYESYLEKSVLPSFKCVSSVQSLSHVRLFVTQWIAAHQASLSITNSQSLPKLLSIKTVMPSSHLILCHPFLHLAQSLPASKSFPMSWFFFALGDQSIGVSASASVPPMNIQDWFPLGLTNLIFLKSPMPQFIIWF